MSHAYRVFGLILRSNLPIPGLEEIESSSPRHDVEVFLGSPPDDIAGVPPEPRDLVFSSSMILESGEPAMRLWKCAGGRLLHWKFFDGMQFWLARDGARVWGSWPQTLSLEDAATYLLGPVLGLLLRLRGVTCLHASAVAFDGRALAFVGFEGCGKSTTAAAFAGRGHAVLSDDITAIEERDGAFYVLPAYPYLSLWPDSVALLYGPEKSLPSFSPNYDKRILTLAGDPPRFEKQSLPLGAIFLLGERSTDQAAPVLETLSPRESLFSLVADSYAATLLDTEMRAREFELLGRITAAVPIRRLRLPDNSARAGHLCDLVLRAYGALCDETLSA